MLDLRKLQIAGPISAQILQYFINISDPCVINLAQLFFDLLLKQWIIKHSESNTILLTEKSMVLIEAVRIAFI